MIECARLCITLPVLACSTADGGNKIASVLAQFLGIAGLVTNVVGGLFSLIVRNRDPSSAD